MIKTATFFCSIAQIKKKRFTPLAMLLAALATFTKFYYYACHASAALVLMQASKQQSNPLAASHVTSIRQLALINHIWEEHVSLQ